jgi:hypothetical protein
VLKHGHQQWLGKNSQEGKGQPKGAHASYKIPEIEQQRGAVASRVNGNKQQRGRIDIAVQRQGGCSGAAWHVLRGERTVNLIMEGLLTYWTRVVLGLTLDLSFSHRGTLIFHPQPTAISHPQPTAICYFFNTNNLNYMKINLKYLK